jgi:hypothetical protein
MLFAFDCAKQNAGCDAYPAVELALRIGRKIQSEFRGEQIYEELPELLAQEICLMAESRGGRMIG